MSYIQNPVTAIVATNCACCGRPLVDAVSVECGVGPICRGKHGYNKPDRDPNWEETSVLLDSLMDEGLEFKPTLFLAMKAQDTRTMVNILAYQAAIGGANIAIFARIILALGYVTFGEKIAKFRGFGIVEGSLTEDGRVLIKMPYKESATNDWRNIPSRRYNGAEKANSVKVEDFDLVRALIAKHYPDAIVKISNIEIPKVEKVILKCDGKVYRPSRYSKLCHSCNVETTDIAFQSGGKWLVCCSKCEEICGIPKVKPVASLPERMSAEQAIAWLSSHNWNVQQNQEGKVLKKGGKTCNGCRGSGRWHTGGTCAACHGRRVTRDTWISPQDMARAVHKFLVRRAKGTTE